MFFSADGPRWLAALLRAGQVSTAVREAAAWSRVSGKGTLRTLARRGAGPLAPAAARRLAAAAMKRDGGLQEWMMATALRPEIYGDIDLRALRPEFDPRRSTDLRRVALSRVMAGSGQAEGGAALAALTGVEERDPTVDRRVLEAAMRQPEWVRRHDGITRAVVRGAMADRLPGEIVHRTRRGEQLPDWLDVMTAARAELASELEELSGDPVSRQLIDVDRLETLLRRWPDRSACADPTIIRDYRLALLRALLVSRYLRWFGRHAAAAAAAGRPGPARARA
jgi:hypothetical protein